MATRTLLISVTTVSCALVLACAPVPEEPDTKGLASSSSVSAASLSTTANTSATPTSGGLPEYRHTAARSRMTVGPGGVGLTEFGIDKLVGPYGTQGVKESTGFEMGLANAGAPTLTRKPFGNSVDAHSEHVRQYFVNAGLPSTEIASVAAHVGGGAGGRVGEPPSAFEVPSYYAVLSRAVGGIPVADSFAWARINEDDAVVEEAVYWPQIAQSAIDQAVGLQQALGDNNALASFRAMLPQGPGRVAIRHSPGTFDGAFDVEAVYDIATAAGPRYFDKLGSEVQIAGTGPTGNSTPRR